LKFCRLLPQKASRSPRLAALRFAEDRRKPREDKISNPLTPGPLPEKMISSNFSNHSGRGRGFSTLGKLFPMTDLWIA